MNHEYLDCDPLSFLDAVSSIFIEGHEQGLRGHFTLFRAW